MDMASGSGKLRKMCARSTGLVKADDLEEESPEERYRLEVLKATTAREGAAF